MFTFTQIMVSRPAFLLERLDARRLLSVSVAIDTTGEAEATDATEVTVDETAVDQTSTGDEAVASDDVLMFKGDVEILTLEAPVDGQEPVQNLEDVVPPGCDNMGEVPIRYTMMPADNERNLDQPVEILTLEQEPVENLEDTGSNGTDGEILTFGGENDPNVIFYSMGSPTPVQQPTGGPELPPPPSQSSALAPAAATKSLSDDVLELSDGNVLAS